MVSCDVVLRLRGYITVRLRSCAVMLGFEQRCIVKREEHSHKSQLGLYFNIAISILGIWRHCLGAQLWWELEMWWQLRWWQGRIPLFFAIFPFFFVCLVTNTVKTMSSVDMQKHTVQWCYGVTVKSQTCLLVRADSRETLTDPQTSPWWLYFFQNTWNLTALVVFFPLIIHASCFWSLYVWFL